MNLVYAGKGFAADEEAAEVWFLLAIVTASTTEYPES